MLGARRGAAPAGDLGRLKSCGHGTVTAIARREVPRDAPDRRDAHTGVPVDFAIRETALQQFDDRPAIGHRLQLGGRAQIAKKAAAFLDALQIHDGIAQGPLMLLFLA